MKTKHKSSKFISTTQMPGQEEKPIHWYIFKSSPHSRIPRLLCLFRCWSESRKVNSKTQHG